MGICRRGKPLRGEGFTLLGILFLVAVLAVGLAALGRVWQTAEKREKEKQLLFVGDQYRRALESYYLASPGQDKHFPKTLADLLEDKRFPNAVRHLRRLYRDPFTNTVAWGQIRRSEEITGVYSLASSTPLKRAGFPGDYEKFAGKDSYRDWVFAAFPKGLPQASGGATGSQAGGREIKLPSPEERKQCDEALKAAFQECAYYAQTPQYESCIEEAARTHASCAYGK